MQHMTEGETAEGGRDGDNEGDDGGKVGEEKRSERCVSINCMEDALRQIKGKTK